MQRQNSEPSKQVSVFQAKNSNAQTVFLLIIFPLFLYGRAAGFEFVNWDDDLYIYNNPAITGFTYENIRSWFTGAYLSLYVPVPLFSYALDYQVCGAHPSCYHVTNLVIHIANGLLVYRIFTRFFPGRLRVVLVALLFLVHPAQVEPVVWLSQRKTLLAGMFVFVSFLAYLKARETERMFPWMVFSAAALLLGLVSKPTVLVLPIMMVVHGFYFSRKKFSRPSVITFFLMVPACAAGLFTLLLYPAVFEAVAKNGASGTLNWLISISAFYSGHLLLLRGQDLFYPLPSWRDLAMAGKVVYALPLAAFLFIGITGFGRRSGYSFWLIWAFIFLLPVMNFLPIPAGDRHLYISMAGFAAALGSLFEMKPRVGVGLLLAAITVCVPISWQRLGVWKNSESLWTSVKVSELSLQVRAKTQLAGHYEDTGKLPEAKKVYWELIEARPFIPYPFINLYNIYVTNGSSRASEVEKAFAETFGPQPGLSEVYRRLLEARGNSPKVDAILREVTQ